MESSSLLSQIKLDEKKDWRNNSRPRTEEMRSRRIKSFLRRPSHSRLEAPKGNTEEEHRENDMDEDNNLEQQQPLDAKERLQRFDLVIQHLHRLRATLALDPSVRDSFQKLQTLTLLAGQSLILPNHHHHGGQPPMPHPNFMSLRPPLMPTGPPTGFLAGGSHHRLPLPPGMPVKPPADWVPTSEVKTEWPAPSSENGGCNNAAVEQQDSNISSSKKARKEIEEKPEEELISPPLAEDEDMDMDILEHIEEDVDIPDDEDEEEEEEDQEMVVTSENNNKIIGSNSIATPKLPLLQNMSNGAKLPQLPPLPPPLLNLEFLKYLMTKTAAMHFGGPAAAAASGGHGGMGGAGSGSGMGGSGGGGGGSSTSGRDVKPHQCQQCLKTFSSNHQLVQHIRVHTGEKPYKCSYCDRRFKQLSHVQQHTRLHTGERPYKCHVPDCGRAFIQLSNLQQHLRNHESQLERLKNRPFHCAICGKGFATESSMRTHNSKKMCKSGRPTYRPNHTALVGGPNPSCCPLCQKLCISGEDLMEHMKYVHKDPNASGVPAKRRNANHPCPVCGKFYVNEGSLRKHLACHPEMTSQLSSSLRMWPCSVCTAVFTHENGLLAHMDQMRMDPKHQFAAQYVLSRAANERREREALLAAHLAMTTNMQPSLLSGHMTSAAAHHMAVAVTAAASVANLGGGTASPSAHSDSSTRISTPMNTAAEMKMEPRTTNVRSPLSLGLIHSAQQQQQQQQQQQMGLGSQGLDYLSGSRNGLDGQQQSRNSSNDLRLGSPGPASNDLMSNNNNAEHIMGSQQEEDRSIGLQLNHRPNVGQQNGIEMANNAAFMALRANPETTIRPLASTGSGLASPDSLGISSSIGGASNDLHNPITTSAASHHDPQFSAASEFINRYRLEQTINQLRGHHGFPSDPRGIAGLPFNQHNQV